MYSFPSKIEIKGVLKKLGGYGEFISIGFLHDNIKNVYIIEKMLHEMI